MILAIDWNVDPEIFKIGAFSLRWYSLLFAAGFVIGFYIVKKMFESEKIPLAWLDSLLIALVIGTVVGARLGHCIFYDWDYYKDHLIEMILPMQFEPTFKFTGYQGLASHGGAIGIILALYFFSKRVSKKSILWILDRVVVPVALAGMFIRLGNLMNSEIIGKEATVSWAFIFYQVDPIPRHPVQLYEAICYLISFVILYRQYWKTNIKDQLGRLFGLFLVLIFGFRFFLEFFKRSQGGFETALGDALSTGQWLSVPFVIVGLYFYLRKKE